MALAAGSLSSPGGHCQRPSCSVIPGGGWDSVQAIDLSLTAPSPAVVTDAFEDGGFL
jgi:hypothetical protein